MTSTTRENEGKVAEKPPRKPFLTIHDVPIFFYEDWNTGIGGGLWSTGLALARYFDTNTISLCHKLVLELGSGNGFLAVCLAAAVSGNASCSIQELVVTDTAEHLPMIRQTLEANSHAFANVQRVTVVEHRWGEFGGPDDGRAGAVGSESMFNETRTVPLFHEQVQRGQVKFDLIVGSDLAYRKELYDPLICSILQYSHDTTVSLIGVTMADTTAEFFDRLDAAGLAYERFADCLVEPEYRGNTFGIFCIRRKHRVRNNR